MSLKQQLIGAIISGDNDKVSNLLVQMNIEEINVKNELGEAALHTACRNKNDTALSCLLAKPGINVNVMNRFGLTPLDVACLRNCHGAVDQLLGSPGIAVNAKNNDGCTPIMRAATMCSKEALAVMLQSSSVDLDVKDNGGRGLEESVEMGWSGRNEKNECLDMIQKEMLKRKKALENEKQKSGEEKLRIGNEKRKNGEEIEGIGKEKIKRINKKIQVGEQRLKENVDSRKLERRRLEEKQNLEMERITGKHRNEKSALEEKFDKDYEDIEGYVTSLKETRKDLVQDIENKTIESLNAKRGIVEAVEDNLECPICMETMKPPIRIWSCRNGHATCETCKGDLSRVKGGPHPPCPTCKSENVDQRAIVVEKLAAAVFTT